MGKAGDARRLGTFKGDGCMTRRKMLLAGAASASAGALWLDAGGAAVSAPPTAFEVTRSEEEWRSALSPAAAAALGARDA